MATLQELIVCEIGDFFAGFGQPGEPETPEEMQRQLTVRVMSLMTNSSLTEPVYQYREIDSGLWDECGVVWYKHCCASPEHETRILYTCPASAEVQELMARGVEAFIPYLHADVTSDEAQEFANKLRNGRGPQC